jgi:negative regulator of flagellin synthesis FlgM
MRGGSNMKVSSDRSLLNLEAYVTHAQKKEDAGQVAKEVSEHTSQKEHVKLSSAARDLQKAQEVIEATPDIREERVRQFRQEIATGNYNPKADEIAAKMLRESIIDTFV